MLLESLRDIAIIVLALESIIIGLVLVLVLLQLRGLAKLLREEISPMLDSAQETVTIVRGTADFVGDSVVRPVIKVASWGSAARRAVQLVLGNGRIRK